MTWQKRRPIWPALFDLSGVRPGPLHVRLTSAIRTAIKAGRILLGAALPLSRALASDLHVSRWTVTQAYGQLVTEGYLAARPGSATRVCWSAEPEDGPVAHATAPHCPVRYDLAQCSPDFRAFPRARWLQAMRAAAETAPFDQLGYSDDGGELRLRAVLADHLNRRRGTAATPSTISVFPGAGSSVAHLSHALADDDGPPLPAIQGADPDRVALVGSMTRTLTPTVNVGWVVAPRRLVRAGRTAWQLPPGPPALTQLALAHFMESGAYDRHLRASRQRLRTRRNALMAALERELPECRIRGAEAGMHLVLELPAGSDIAAIRAAADRRSMRLCDVNDTRFQPDPEESLLQVGYGNLADLLVGEAVAVLADVIRRSAAR